jgi:dTDP-4-dehydrorhamnose 3,5-epimerase
MREKPILTKTNVFSDDRGTFFPLDLKEPRWIQSNVSISKKWTFRGLHHQIGNTAQSKLVTVIKGEILDFIVDLRKESFGDVFFFRMQPGDQLYVPKRFAHGFLALQEDTIIQYLVDNDYSPESEGSIYWKEIDRLYDILISYYPQIHLGVDTVIMSDKDYITKNFKIKNDGK